MTVPALTAEQLKEISRDRQKALQMAYDMLCAIQNGKSFDTADYLTRKGAIAAAIDLPAERGNL